MKTASKTHPMIIVAAASVTVLSLAGVATLAGWLPGRGEASALPSPLVASTPATTATTARTEGPATLAIPSGSTITVKPKSEARVASNRAARPVEPTAANVPPPQGGYTRVANPSAPAPNDSGIYVENARPAGNTPPTSSAPAVCHSCGTIQSVQEISNKGEGTGLGAVAGGVLGGLLGSQIGGGNGKKAMAVVGAAGGAFAGHEVEKRVRGETQYQITVRFDDGNTRTYTETTATQLQSGDRVRLENGRLVML